jgi:hypothetical protein
MLVMADDRNTKSPSGVIHGLSTFGTRAAAATIRPLTRPVGAAADAGISLQRRAFDRLLDSGEVEAALASPRLQALVQQVLESDGAKMLVDAFFDSGLFDRLADRLVRSDALWRLVDEIAGSPAVTAAISQQGLGFADQVGTEVRGRSRKADDWLERKARRLTRRDAADKAGDPEADPEATA